MRFQLEDVVNTKPLNNCPDCIKRVDSYLKSVTEWQAAYDNASKERDAWKKTCETLEAECSRLRAETLQR